LSQKIEVEMFVEKGVARTHAKWSPVATASYRLLPDILLPKPVKDDLADELVRKCPMKVFDIEDLGDGHRQATGNVFCHISKRT
jgi:DNA-directed RNA polymerase I and III subunit RPAC1